MAKLKILTPRQIDSILEGIKPTLYEKLRDYEKGQKELAKLDAPFMDDNKRIKELKIQKEIAIYIINSSVPLYEGLIKINPEYVKEEYNTCDLFSGTLRYTYIKGDSINTIVSNILKKELTIEDAINLVNEHYDDQIRLAQLLASEKKHNISPEHISAARVNIIKYLKAKLCLMSVDSFENIQKNLLDNLIPSDFYKIKESEE